jgi:probable rRNA maturation factor
VLDVSIVATPADRAAVRGLAPWLVRTAPRALAGTVIIAIVTDRRMRALNRQFRGVDASTDVLSFPAFAGLSSDTRRMSASARASGPGPGGYLGDIAIARGVAARQAKSAGHALATEFRVLALHGLLHLAGYDHETDDGEMARVEARLRRKGGLTGGLIERAGRTRPAAAGRTARSRR